MIWKMVIEISHLGRRLFLSPASCSTIALSEMIDTTNVIVRPQIRAYFSGKIPPGDCSSISPGSTVESTPTSQHEAGVKYPALNFACAA
jgi:hypothetical protein